MKTKRHAKILEIIHSTPVDTQDELLKRLRECGFDVTKATVSRDIKELRLIKTLDSDGRYRYSTVKQENDHISSKFHSLFSDAVVGVDYERIQSDVFDHVLAVIPEFGLRVFQNPSGADVVSLRAPAPQGNVPPASQNTPPAPQDTSPEVKAPTSTLPE